METTSARAQGTFSSLVRANSETCQLLTLLCYQFYCRKKKKRFLYLLVGVIVLVVIGDVGDPSVSVVSEHFNAGGWEGQTQDGYILKL